MPFKIVRNDITKMKADAIVNTAAPEPGFGQGTESAIYKRAGIRKLFARRKEIGRIETGEAEITSAFSLDAKYIIHTVGPLWQGGQQGEGELLLRCYKNSLRLAVKQGCESIAFPLISAGSLGFPKALALETAIQAIRSFLSEEEMLVYLVVFDEESFELSGELYEGVESYIDEHYVADRLAEEYSEPPGYTKGSDRRSVPKPASNVISMHERAAGNAAVPRLQRKVEKHPPVETPKFLKADEDKYLSQEKAVFQEKKCQPMAAARSLEDVVAQLGETFQQRLLRLIDERGMTDVEVYKRANLDRKLFSKIRCNVNYRPKKITAVALAIALGLNLDETRDLLSRAELALSPSSKFDLIITFFIEQKVYDIYTINLALFEHEQPLLA